MSWFLTAAMVSKVLLLQTKNLFEEILRVRQLQLPIWLSARGVSREMAGGQFLVNWMIKSVELEHATN